MSQSEKSVYTISQMPIKANSYAEEKFKLEPKIKSQKAGIIFVPRGLSLFMKWKNETKVFSPG